MAILLRLFGLIAPKTFLIICLFNLLTLGVPDEGYSRNAWCALNLISTFLLVILGHQRPLIAFCYSTKVDTNSSNITVANVN